MEVVLIEQVTQFAYIAIANYSYSKDVKVSGRIEGFIDNENLNIIEAGCSNWLHFYIYSLDTQQVFYT